MQRKKMKEAVEMVERAQLLLKEAGESRGKKQQKNEKRQQNS